ncbi:restriction endonuclease [Fulvivirga lutimaris]|uniref:restriction endonuclease n=1 Tax=Fulvivirga lutimaris TaxID=1819566 RepID=UPI0012BD8207|nr:restriction endonuclease [Fulvivirga lutimaris]MTI38275.1 hypothetical protein [Fulvivirga lutimaris]
MIPFSLDEIENEDEFEDLAAAYFKDLVSEQKNDISRVETIQSGKGPDGGRDILVHLGFSDEVSVFERTWVVQCKFYNDSVGPSHINEINLPSLIHSYNAIGYLLICKNGVTSGISNLFERLSSECSFGYKYKFWNGNEFKNKLIMRESLHEVFFPKYYSEMLKIIRK